MRQMIVCLLRCDSSIDSAVVNKIWIVYVTSLVCVNCMLIAESNSVLCEAEVVIVKW